jgi:hypothetical protein
MPFTNPLSLQHCDWLRITENYDALITQSKWILYLLCFSVKHNQVFPVIVLLQFIEYLNITK